MSIDEQSLTAQRTRGSMDWTPAFLSALEETGVISRACDAANISRTSVWTKRQEDSDFAARVETALQAGALLLEAEAIRRAYDGVQRKQFTGRGEPIIDPETGKQYVELEYSDRLLEVLLKARKPEYKDKPAETHVTSVVNNLLVLTSQKQTELQDRMRQALPVA